MGKRGTWRLDSKSWPSEEGEECLGNCQRGKENDWEALGWPASLPLQSLSHVLPSVCAVVRLS